MAGPPEFDTRCAGFAWWASLGATAASITARGNRVASTASGCHWSIIWSKRERKKSPVDIWQVPQESALGGIKSWNSTHKIHAGK